MGLLGTDSQARLPSISTGPVVAAVFRGESYFNGRGPQCAAASCH